jgi:hypothetical protein
MPKIGEAFGWWEVVDAAKVGRKHHRVLCRCRCGKEVLVVLHSLLTGRSKSCGCRPKNKSDAVYMKPEYRTWENMKSRCQNPRHTAFQFYGGRGIKVCERWQVFTNFFADMGERPTLRHEIDRIDTNGHYEPGNCRWATRKEQQNNIRSNRFVTIGSVRWNVVQWSEATGTSQRLISQRLSRGWPEREAVFGRNMERSDR